MAFAPHHNGEVTKDNGLPFILGGFYEKDFGNFFEYAENNTGLFPEYPHIVYVGNAKFVGGDCGYRFANVKKTVAYILCDNDKLAKWNIKNHKEYMFSCA